MTPLGGAVAAMLGIICLMITGAAVRARQVGEDSLSQSHHVTPILAPLVTSAILLVAILGITKRTWIYSSSVILVITSQ